MDTQGLTFSDHIAPKRNFLVSSVRFSFLFPLEKMTFGIVLEVQIFDLSYILSYTKTA